jgi:hypothetical protein
MRLIVFTALLLALFVSAPVGAADGASCASNRKIAGYISQCVMLCDAKTSADSSCTQYNFVSPPDIIHLEIAEDDGCSAAAAATFTHQSATDTDTHNLNSWALTRGGDTSVTIEGTSGQPLAYLNTALGTMTNCTNFDLKMHLYYERR